MSLFLDIGTGAGLASATGIRPYLPPLLAGGLARSDIGIDFDGTDLLVARVHRLPRGRGRAGRDRLLRRTPADEPCLAGQPGRIGRGPAEILSGLIGVALGTLLFAGALLDNGQPPWIGLVFGPLCVLLAWVAVGGSWSACGPGSNPTRLRW